MTYSTAELNEPAGSVIPSDEEVHAAGIKTAAQLLDEALELLGQRWHGAEFDDDVADYEQRLAENRPYENTVDREEFRRRYGV